MTGTSTPPRLPGILEDLKGQCLRILPVLFVIYVPVGAVLFGLFLVWAFTDVPIRVLTRDPLSVVESALLRIQERPNLGLHDLAELAVPHYAGIVSNLGIILWCSTGAVCFLVYTSTRCLTGPLYPPRFFLWSGLITALLLADDFFLLHERALPLAFSIDEKYIFAVYGLCTALYLVAYRATLLQTDYLLLVIAFVLFGSSLVVDIVPYRIMPQPHFFEDGGKFAGIAGWTGYYVRTGFHQLRAGLVSAGAKEA